MSQDDESTTSRRLAWLGPTIWGPTLLVAGLAGVVASVLAPKAALQTATWTEEDAMLHQSASEELHRLSLSATEGEEAKSALIAARAKFVEVDERLVEAAEAPRRWRDALRWGGAILCVVGGIIAVATRQ